MGIRVTHKINEDWTPTNNDESTVGMKMKAYCNVYMQSMYVTHNSILTWFSVLSKFSWKYFSFFSLYLNQHYGTCNLEN